MGTMKQYKELAKYYDTIYSFKDYRNEALELNALIRKYKKSDGNSLLDVGCGTGRHLLYLKKSFDCTGVDLNEEMLRIARDRVKGVKFIRGDMMSLSLGAKFDAIVVLFSAIGYVKTYAKLKMTIANFYNMLKPGGVLIIDGWFTRKQFKVGKVHLRTSELEGLKIARLGFSRIRGNVSILEEHYLVAEANRGIDYYVDVQELGLFEKDKFVQIMKDAGFDSRTFEASIMGRHRYLGVKPLSV